MSFSRMISTAAKCSLVCGCGQDSLAAISSSAPSMTAAPLSIVAIRMSWPGQSTNDTWRTRSMGPPHLFWGAGAFGWGGRRQGALHGPRPRRRRGRRPPAAAAARLPRLLLLPVSAAAAAAACPRAPLPRLHAQVAGRAVLLAAAVGAVARRPLAAGALVHLGVGVAGGVGAWGGGVGERKRRAVAACHPGKRSVHSSWLQAAASRPRLRLRRSAAADGCPLLRPPPPLPKRRPAPHAPQLDGDVALQLILEAHRLHARDGLDHRRLAVRHVADRACMRWAAAAVGGEPGAPRRRARAGPVRGPAPSCRAGGAIGSPGGAGAWAPRGRPGAAEQRAAARRAAGAARPRRQGRRAAWPPGWSTRDPVAPQQGSPRGWLLPGRRWQGAAPILIVACRLMTSGDSGVSFAGSSVLRSCGGMGFSSATARGGAAACGRRPAPASPHLLLQPLALARHPRGCECAA
jgi:hypothetical protein